MNIYCQKCGEPFDMFEITDEFNSWERSKFHGGAGCPACLWGKSHKRNNNKRAQMSALLHEFLGDDIDGIASELDLAEYCGLFDD